MSNTTSRSVPELMAEIELLTAEIQELYLRGNPLVIGWSGGKDSTTVLQLIWSAIKKLQPEQRIYPFYVLTNDTLVENPVVVAQVRSAIKQMELTAIEQQMPVKTIITTPDIKNTFWVCLIGKGYPAPRNRFRWCTDRLKIKPAAAFIQQSISTCGQVVLALGTRSAESSTRAANMAKHRESRVGKHLNPNPANVNSLMYFLIEDWRTDEVWLYLMQFDNPWGCDNKDLFAMYRGATADNECPLVVDTSTPSCGSSRFGCWTCTMVSKDKSMEAMILNDAQKEWMQPLLDIRNELDVEDDRDKRDFRRMGGGVDLYERNMGEGEVSIQPIPGPYVKFWREHWLRRVLEAQTHVRKVAPPDMRDITLITSEELSEIRRIWIEEKHEFDDSLPEIYEQATGEPFVDTRHKDERSILGSEEWDTLVEVCGEDEMHLQLMASLLGETSKTYLKARRTNVFKPLEKAFQSSSRSKDEALTNAHEKRVLTAAIESKDSGESGAVEIKKLMSKDAEAGKQLSWGDIKFDRATEN